MIQLRHPACSVLALILAPFASGQNDIGWASFAQDDARLSGPSALSLTDPEEKDYAWGDLDQDGDDDLVCVRKQPFTTEGRFANVLFMNEGGVLTIRSTEFASASDVPGDQGFLTPTNDRDVILADVDQDGWLDVITATTLTPSAPKHISHPRIYINLGSAGDGTWLGLMHQDARFPQLALNNVDTFPKFCGLGAGDVTGDGFPDLFFAHYDAGNSAGLDLEDRLLVNDGSGFFVDESNARMTSAMLNSGFGTSAQIADINGDTFADVLDGESGKTAVSYNNPNNGGTFNLLDPPYSGAAYHVSSGDLNQDDRLDLLVSDDGLDRYILNLGNDALGRVVWGPFQTYNIDDGFASNNMTADIDGDGWPEALYSDVDVDIPGCARRAHIYHNRGGQAGGAVEMHEEAGGGSVGAMGIATADLRGMHDIAAFDLEGDGDIDLIFGRCVGTSVWVNQQDPGDQVSGISYCDPAVTNSSGQPGIISATGSSVASNNMLTVTASQLPTNQFGYVLASMTQGFIPNPGGSQGNLCLSGTIGRFLQQVQNSGSGGAFSINVDLSALPGPLPTSVMAGDTWNFSAWFRDNNPASTSNFTNGISILFQ